MESPTTSEVEETVTQSTHEDEDAELLTAIKMSLEEPDAETTRDSTMGDNTPIDKASPVRVLSDKESETARELHNSAVQLIKDFQQSGEGTAIDNAVQLMKEVIMLTPDGYAHKAERLSDLGTAFQSRFEHLGELEDIGNAILVQQQAVDLTPDGHADKATLLSNLGNAFQSRFQRLGELGDIENAILVDQQVVDLTPDGHADKTQRLNNLGSTLFLRFERLGELRDIENAILVKKQAVYLTPDGHADKAALLNNLGNAFQSRFERLGEPEDIMKATAAYQQATRNTSSTPSTRYDAASRWAILCSKHQSPSSALDAYNVVLEIIPQVDWLGQTAHCRYEQLPQIGRTINAAVAIAISAGNLPRAVEWFEEGRRLVWKQILQLRTPLDELRQHHPELANELSRVSLALENAGTSGFDDIGSEAKQKSVEARNRHSSAVRYEELLAQVRELDGFGSFLRPKEFSELVSAASEGPVVVVNVAELRCDALVLCTSGEIVHVPLPTFSYRQAEALHLKLLSSLRAKRVWDNRNGDRAIHLAGKDNQDHFISVLADLWSHVVQPIVSEIEVVSLPHITWCATGALTFLPLHAAGIYGFNNPTKNVNVSDFAVSSYTATLTAMLGSGSKPKQDPTVVRSVLIVSQPATPGQRNLPGTLEEAKSIQLYASDAHTRHLTNELATVQAVSDEMSKHDIIHLACYGIQDMKNPLHSAFVLHDGRLELNRLMKLSLKNAELAFLSACQSTTDDEKLPEEAVYLAAGMLAVGYPSVIATMWSIGDNDAPLIADKVYANLLGCRNDSEIQDAKLTPAYALHEAVKHLRKKVGEMNFVRWVPFVHFGV
ncbi:hypothetical protein K435DRAFT_808714 [Dendrothele bispora CBS 962.96]|uniref:CHAT domain-containing protein n=1 Tax=Dendrothele bispora (strain CBS 962.96) TaxID=1314807 RepID=A0A4S8L0J1_DENBC|nr:hypothetical protein K435DRAFT_808714 [Dendrothele bispora CBS 962.96]